MTAPAQTPRTGRLAIIGVLLGAAVGGTALLLLPSYLSSALRVDEHIYWYLSRASALAAYFLLWASVFAGFMIAGRAASVWPGAQAATQVHQFASLLGMGLAVFHALILMGDAYIRYSLADVLVPFAGTQYEPLWVGAGQTALYGGIIVTASWYVRDRIGYRTWRRLHYLTIAVFSTALAHGIYAGTDTQHPAVTGLYWATGGLALFALLYRIIAVRGPGQVPQALGGPGQQAGDALPSSGGEVTFLPGGKPIAARPGQTILEIAERNGFKLPAGCRTGACGVDPVFIASGTGALSPAGRDERATLDRLGLSAEWRLACSAKIRGKVAVSRQPVKAGSASPGGAPALVPAQALNFIPDAAVRNVVIIGNGVAGTTAADLLRRYLPDSSITIISREPRLFYNRMGIARLIEGGATPSDLTIAPDSWYEERRIECLLGAEAVRIDRERRVVVTDRGRYLEYDRLLLAGGSGPAVPPVRGWGIPGCFTLRDADDAMAIRDHIRHHGSKVALVLGGGLLGLEAAHSLRAAGLKTTVLDRNAWVMHRQADEECGRMLQAALADLGVQVRTGVNIAEVIGAGRVTAVSLENGETVPCDVLLASTGIAPGLSLASDAGIETRRGILVDDHMRTSDARAYAAGDIAEHRGAVYGLWGASADQARVAALNMAGANESYRGSITAAQLKVAGIEFTSFGEISGKQGDLTFSEADAAARKYRKLVVRDGKLVGAVLLGHPELAGEMVEKARSRADISKLAAALDRGDWRALAA